MTVSMNELQQTQGGKVYTADHTKIGSIGQIYLDDESGEPSWVTAKTGFFGTAESFIPLQGARVDGDDLVVSYDEQTIKNAPRVDPDGHLEPHEEDALYQYYNLGDSDESVRTGQADQTDRTEQDANGSETGRFAQAAGDEPVDAHDPTEHGDDRADMSDQTVGQDRSGPTTDDAMTRSEERLNVGTATRESGKARLRKYVTSETVTQTVPVRHEEVTLEREPITEANRGAAESGAAITEEEHEVVLHEEVPVVDKDVVAVERVKLGKETVTEDATVSEDIRSENIEMVDPHNTDQS